MNKKYFISAFIFVFVSAACGIGAWLYTSWRNSLSVGGAPTFAATKAKMSYLGKIKITNPGGSEITLSRQEGIWHFEEAKNYFANLNQMNDMLRMLNDSSVISAEETGKHQLERRGLDTQSGVLLQTYTLDNKILDSLIIGKKDGKKICYARQPQSETYTLRISSCGSFSGQPADWIPYPLLSVPHDEIARIQTPEKELYDNEIHEQIMQSSDMRRFILALGAVDYQGIALREELLNNPNLEISTRQIEVELKNGLVYIFNIHLIEGSYWLEPAMKVGKIARKSVPEFIEKNRSYFENWLFQLGDAQGKILYNFKG